MKNAGKNIRTEGPQPAGSGVLGSGRSIRRAILIGLPILAGTLGLAAHMAQAALPPVPVPAENPITEAKRVLGKMLFWDEQMSTSDVMSCGSCHTMNRNGSDARAARNPGIDNLLNTGDDILGSPGIIMSDVDNDFARSTVFGLAPQITSRSAQPNINSAYFTDLFWDGRARTTFTDPQTLTVAIATGGGLESQSVAPPLNNTEMAHAGLDWAAVSAKLQRVKPLQLATNLPADVASALTGQPDYPELFRRAFGDTTINARRIAFALATYQRTLISDQSPFDRFQAGQTNALTQNQINGMNAFRGPGAACNVCHTAFAPPPPPGQPPQPDSGLFTSNTFRNIGLRPNNEDLGRQIVTGNPADRGRFKAPSLRNIGLKSTFMHNGQFNTLPQVLAFYAQAPGAPIRQTNNLDPAVAGINGQTLPPQAAAQIVDFLQNALTDPRVANATFPFDQPTLFVNRTDVRPTVLGGGVAGSGAVTPRIIVQGPAYVGNPDFRVGLDGAVGGASAQLGISMNAPVNGRITPQLWLSVKVAEGTGTGAGLATEHLAINGHLFRPGTYYMQWFVADVNAAGGTSISAPAQVPVFCTSSSCVIPCSPADIAYGNGEPLPPFGRPGGFNPQGPDGGDFDCFFNAFFAAAPDNAICDIAYGDGEPIDPFHGSTGFNPGVDGGDFDCFFNFYFNGCN